MDAADGGPCGGDGAAGGSRGGTPCDQNEEDAVKDVFCPVGVPRPWTGTPSRSAAALRSTDAQLWAALGSGALTMVTMAWRGTGAGLVRRVAGEEVEYAVRARSALAQM